MNIYIRVGSMDFWWGYYGLTPLTGWEDVILETAKGKTLGEFCINTKQYLRSNLEELRSEPEEAAYVLAIERYLKDTEAHFWQYDDASAHGRLSETVFPEDKKIPFTDLWHPHEGISLDTIYDAAALYAKNILHLSDVKLQMKESDSFGEIVAEYYQHSAHL